MFPADCRLQLYYEPRKNEKETLFGLSMCTYLLTGWETSSENEYTTGESKSSLLPYVTDGGNLLHFFLLTGALAYDQEKINNTFHHMSCMITYTQLHFLSEKNWNMWLQKETMWPRLFGLKYQIWLLSIWPATSFFFFS